MGTFSVKVVNSSGEAVSGIDVTVDFGIMNGQTSEYTDSDGWAYFNNNGGDFLSGDFFVDGQSVGNYSTYDGRSLSFTL